MSVREVPEKDPSSPSNPEFPSRIVTEGLVSYWTMDNKDLSGSVPSATVKDIWGDNDGTTSGTITTGATGKINEALDFDGVDDYVQAGRALSSGNATISVWAKWEGTLDPGNAQHVIWGQFDLNSELDAGQTTKNMPFLQAHGWSDTFMMNYQTDAGDSYDVISISLDNNWHHFAGVLREGEPILLYVDGVKYSGEILPSSLVYDDMPSGFSIYGNRNAYFNGTIDEVGIYDRALSDDEIKQIYQVTNPNRLRAEPSQIVTDGLVSYWTMDDKDLVGSVPNATVKDIWENNNGTTSGTLTTGATGKINEALDFDGVDDYVESPMNGFPDPMKNITITLWARIDVVQQSSVIQAQPDDTSNRLNIHLPWGGGIIYWDFGDINAGGRLSTSWNSAWTDSWEHFTFVSENGVGQKIYHNGSVIASDTDTDSFSKGTKNLIFGRAGSDDYYDGKIDDVRIYDRALSDSEIRRNYLATRNKLGRGFPAQPIFP